MIFFPFYFDTVSIQNTLKLKFVPCPPAIIPVTPPSSQLINDNPTVKANIQLNYFVKVWKPLSHINFTRKTYNEYTILTLSQFSLCAQTIPELYRAN